jgi:histidine ammonia-lyase
MGSACSATKVLWRHILDGRAKIALAEGTWASVERSRAVLERALAEGRTYRGVNTGFGQLAQTRIQTGELKHLQRNLVLRKGSRCLTARRFRRARTRRALRGGIQSRSSGQTARDYLYRTKP